MWTGHDCDHYDHYPWGTRWLLSYRQRAYTYNIHILLWGVIIYQWGTGWPPSSSRSLDFPQGELDRSAPQTAFPDRHHDYLDFDYDDCNFDYLDFDGNDQFDITAAMVLRVKMAVIATLWSFWGTWRDGEMFIILMMIMVLMMMINLLVLIIMFLRDCTS